MAQQCSHDSSGGAAQLTFAELPDNAAQLTVAFYNVGIQVSELEGKNWKTKEGRLQADILKAFNTHALDILCLCELGELGVGIGASVPHGDVVAWIMKLFNDSAIPPVEIFTDSHYLTIVKTSRVKVDLYKLVHGFVPNQNDRSFQHLRVSVAGDEAPISIINCHAPASKKRVLSADGRKRYVRAAHDACAGDRFIWGGDFNTGSIQLTALMTSIDSRYTSGEGDLSSAAQPGAVQVLYSHPIRNSHGDLAVSYGLGAIQINSQVGRNHKGVSDAHDLVIAKVFATDGSPRLPADPSGSVAPLTQPQWPKTTSSAPLPKKSATALSSSSNAKVTPWNTGITIQPTLPSAPSANIKCEMPTRQPPRFRLLEDATVSGSAPQLGPPILQVKRSSPEVSCKESTPVTRIHAPRHAAAINLDPATDYEGDDSSSSAAQPVRMLCLTSKATPPKAPFQLLSPPDESPSSAALPSTPPMDARSEHETGESAGTGVLFTPVPSTTLRGPIPRVTAIFGSDAEHTAALRDLLEKIAKEFLYDKVSRIVVTTEGCYEAAASVNNLEKLEMYLQVIQGQREKHLRRHPDLAPDAVFNSWDMQEIYNTWMEDHTSWMNAKNIEVYKKLLDLKGRGVQQKAHQMRRSSFAVYLFQILGNKHVLLASVKYPLCSAEQPAQIIDEFMTSWNVEKATDEYKKRVQISEKATEERKQLKKKAHAARQNLVRGIKINNEIKHSLRFWINLSADEKTLVEDFNSGQLICRRNDCDAAFGWDKQQRDAVQSAAARLKHQVPA
jgi:hypothetical protein